MRERSGRAKEQSIICKANTYTKIVSIKHTIAFITEPVMWKDQLSKGAESNEK